MESDRLLRWLTIGANLGVLVGLLLLIAELKQNRDMMRAEIRHELAMGIVDLLQTPADNSQLADVLFRGVSGGALTPTESFQFEMRTNALFRYWEDVHYQYRVGLYDQAEFSTQREAWRVSLAGSPLARDYWCGVRALYSPEFAAEMDSLLVADPCAAATMTALTDLATRYAAAWSSQDPLAFAAFYAEDGTFRINDGEPSIGRDEIAETARGFMSAFPDMVVRLVEIRRAKDHVEFHWHWTGTNTGPGGTGNAVDLYGFEQWTLDDNGLILESRGNLDDAEYQRQLHAGQASRDPEP